MAQPVPGSTPGVRLVVVHPDKEVLAQAAAARLLTRVLDVQSVRSPVHVVLTGGSVGIATLAAVASSPLVPAVDWSGVHLWWGDERFLPDGDHDRNDTQARQALLDGLVAEHGLSEGNIHPMPGPTSVASPEESAAAYATLLRAHADGQDGTHAVPAFDVLLLGMGPDGHVASLFPGHEGLAAAGTTTGVHGSPKPPLERVSLTFDAIRSAREVWIVAAGAEKAEPVAAALADEPVTTVPAAGAVGQARTLWLLDVDASGTTTPR